MWNDHNCMLLPTHWLYTFHTRIWTDAAAVPLLFLALAFSLGRLRLRRQPRGRQGHGGRSPRVGRQLSARHGFELACVHDAAVHLEGGDVEVVRPLAVRAFLDEAEVRVAKRSGIMDPMENFFGYHVLLPEFTERIKKLKDLIKARYKLDVLPKVVMNGELFGAKYEHPDVPKSRKWCKLPSGQQFPIAGVTIQKEPFPQYSPEIHFYLFDIRYWSKGQEKIVTYDEMVWFARQMPGQIYAKALVRGSLEECLAFDVENFQTPLPALLGLGNYPLENNLAEGVIVRHVKRGSPEIEAKKGTTILKIRCSAFMELKHPEMQKELKASFFDTIRKAAVASAGDVLAISESLLPDVEAKGNALLLNHVSKGRLANVVSKIGREPLQNGTTSQEQLALLLAKDALKDFLKEGDDIILNTSIAFRRQLIRHAYYEATQLVRAEWANVTSDA